MLYAYVVISAAAVPILDKFLPILRQSYSWWLVPVMFVGGIVALILLQVIISAVSFAVVNMEKPPKAPRYYRFIAKNIVSLLVPLVRLKIETENAEKLPDSGRFIIVCNHRHISDPVALLWAFPDSELTFLSKREVSDYPIVGKALHSIYGVFIDRDSMRDSAKAIVSAIKLIKDDRASVGIFPEGHRTIDGELLPFKSGAFKIAQKTKSPVVVCDIRGSEKIFNKFILKKHTIKIKLLDVITHEQYADMTADELCEKSRNIILEDLKSNT